MTLAITVYRPDLVQDSWPCFYVTADFYPGIRESYVPRTSTYSDAVARATELLGQSNRESYEIVDWDINERVTTVSSSP